MKNNIDIDIDDDLDIESVEEIVQPNFVCPTNCDRNSIFSSFLSATTQIMENSKGGRIGIILDDEDTERMKSALNYAKKALEKKEKILSDLKDIPEKTSSLKRHEKQLKTDIEALKLEIEQLQENENVKNSLEQKAKRQEELPNQMRDMLINTYANQIVFAIKADDNERVNRILKQAQKSFSDNIGVLKFYERLETEKHNGCNIDLENAKQILAINSNKPAMAVSLSAQI